MNLTGKDLLLLLLYSPLDEDEECCSPIAGRTRLSKMIFIFEKEIWPDFKFDKLFEEDSLPDFYAWKFGPFSGEVFEDIDFFASIGFIQTTGISDPAPPEEAFEMRHWSSAEGADQEAESELGMNEYSEEKFSLTSLGKKYVEDEELWAQLSEDQQKALSDLKRKFTNAPLNMILRYVYRRYPDMAEESEIKDQVLS